jgi:hypothetical protein
MYVQSMEMTARSASIRRRIVYVHTFRISRCNTRQESILYKVLLLPITKLWGSARCLQKPKSRGRLLANQTIKGYVLTADRQTKELSSKVEVAYWPTRQSRAQLK